MITTHIEPNPEEYAQLSKEYTNFVVAAEIIITHIELIIDGDIHCTMRLHKMCKGILRHNTLVPAILCALREQDDGDDD